MAGTEVGRVEIRPPRSVEERNTKCCQTGYSACQQIHEGAYWKSLSCSLWHSAESLESPPLTTCSPISYYSGSQSVAGGLEDSQGAFKGPQVKSIFIIILRHVFHS